MSAIPPEKLDRIIHRFAAAEHDMSSGAMTGDAFVRLSREYAELEPAAKKARELRKAYDERHDLTEIVEAGGELAAAGLGDHADRDRRALAGLVVPRHAGVDAHRDGWDRRTPRARPCGYPSPAPPRADNPRWPCAEDVSGRGTRRSC